jgi:hypothetical protein
VAGARLLLTVILASAAFGALPRPTYAAAIPNYDLKITLDYAAGTAAVSESVVYTNRTGAQLKTVAFSVVPQHYKAFSLRSATVDGAAVQATFADISLEVPLTKPLPPGDAVAIGLEFTVTVPLSRSGRFGRTSDITAMGNFFPMAQVFKDGQWPRYKYTDVGDVFFTEASDFEVSLTLTNAPPTTIVAHSGELVARDGPRWVLRGRGIRDFALSISHRYEATSEQVGSTSISVFYLPEHEAAGRQMLQTGVDLLRWAGDRLGPYPYPSLHIAESPGFEGVGQEYPNLVFIGTGTAAGPAGAGSYLAYLVAHELIHQWFYGLVGNDQVAEPWIDEGVTVHLSYLYLKTAAPSAYESMWANLVRSHRDAVAQLGIDPPLDASIYDYEDDNQYFALLYRKSALFLEEMRTRMGDAAYFAMLKDFGAQHRHGIATTSDFLLFAAGRYGPNFAGVAVRYFSPAAMRVLQPATPTVPPSVTAAVATPTPPASTATAAPASPTTVASPSAEPPPAKPTAVPGSVPPAPPDGERITRVADADLETLMARMPTPPAAATVIVASTVERQYPVDAPVAGLLGLLVGLAAGYVLGGRRTRRRRW